MLLLEYYYRHKRIQIRALTLRPDFSGGSTVVNSTAGLSRRGDICSALRIHLIIKKMGPHHVLSSD